MKRLLCAIVCGASMLHSAAALPAMGDLTAKSAALYDQNGQMLYEYNAEEQLQPASVTKIMTMLLAIEAIDRGEVSLDDLVTGSAHAASMGGTQIWLKEGEQLTMDEMLKAIAVGSANDCAVAVAEHLAGTEAAFVEKMNERAAELGCTGTKFVNANGLDAGEEKTMTTARDLALISVELLRHPKILEYTSIWMDTIRNGEFSLANTNKMLRSYDGMVGLKTGYISEAGFCIAAAAERDGMTLIATVMAAPTKEDRMADTTALLNYGFANFGTYTPDLRDALTPVAVSMGQSDSVGVIADFSGTLIVEKEKMQNIEVRVELPQQVDAPVALRQKLGQAQVMDGETVLASIDLTAASEVGRLRYTDLLHALLCAALGKA